MSNFSAAQARALFDAVRSQAQQLGIFQNVDTHEPQNAPGNRLYCSINLGPIRPTTSGLAAVSGRVTLIVRVWSAAMQRPLDDIDPEALATVSALMGALAGSFTLGGSVRDIDLMQMSAQPGYVDFQEKQFRVVEITVPVEINDMFAEVP